MTPIWPYKILISAYIFGSNEDFWCKRRFLANEAQIWSISHSFREPSFFALRVEMVLFNLWWSLYCHVTESHTEIRAQFRAQDHAMGILTSPSKSPMEMFVWFMIMYLSRLFKLFFGKLDRLNMIFFWNTWVLTKSITIYEITKKICDSNSEPY